MKILAPHVFPRIGFRVGAIGLVEKKKIQQAKETNSTVRISCLG
jgi:hypothetical protein